jgi:CxxC-x17-CxxC domain-containing protein
MLCVFYVWCRKGTDITFEPSEGRPVYCSDAMRSDLADHAGLPLKISMGQEHLACVSLESGLHNLRRGMQHENICG